MTQMCEAHEWANWTGQESGPCPNEATHCESWFDEEGVEVWLCDAHDSNEDYVDIKAADSEGAD